MTRMDIRLPTRSTASRSESWSAQTRLEVPDKATPLRFLPTAIPPSSAGSPTTGSGGRRGSKGAAAVLQPQRLGPIEVLRFTAREVRIPEGALQSPGRALEYEQGAPRPVICESRYQMDSPRRTQPLLPLPECQRQARAVGR